jgi:hypothetical protein
MEADFEAELVFRQGLPVTVIDTAPYSIEPMRLLFEQFVSQLDVVRPVMDLQPSQPSDQDTHCNDQKS